jgi:hypothetical protein
MTIPDSLPAELLPPEVAGGEITASGERFS